MSTKYPWLPYVFQDPNVAGAIDFNYIFGKDSLSTKAKEILAKQLVELLLDCLVDNCVTEKLSEFLKENPSHKYIEYLNRYLQLYLSESFFGKKSLYEFGIQLTTQSDNIEEVKLGMLILGVFENDISKQILKTLGLHSEFTLYALEASKNFRRHNTFVFELAQNTLGYGKLLSLFLLNPITQEQIKWTFEQGAINEVNPNLAAIICLEKTDMIGFYRDLVMSKDNFSSVSYLFAFALENSDLKDFSIGIELATKYIRTAADYSRSFIDYAALILIQRSVLLDNEANYPQEIQKQCLLITKQPRWEVVVINELNNPSLPTSLIVEVINSSGFLPHFRNFTQLLLKDPYDMELLNFFLVINPKHYWQSVYYYLLEQMPLGVLDVEPQYLSDDDLGVEHKPDFWLVYLLKAMRKEKHQDEDFYLRCLTARFQDVRIEAVEALKAIKPSWSKNVVSTLEKLYPLEPHPEIKKNILSLIGKKKEKKQQFVDISPIQITPSPFDIYLFDTYIAGTSFHDLSVIDGKVKIGDTLYLLRKPNNPYDKNAILVVTEIGYVLGYIPKVSNKLLALKMDNGEKIYAVLLTDALNDRLDIQIMQCKERPET